VKLASLYATIGAMISSFDMYAGLILIKLADDRSEEVVRACRHNKSAWRWLERIVNSSDVGSCIVGHGLMLYAILVHAGRLKGDVNNLAMFGLAEYQIMAPPPGMPTQEEMNAGFNTLNGHRGN
jgi:hypothetical protein